MGSSLGSVSVVLVRQTADAATVPNRRAELPFSRLLRDTAAAQQGPGPHRGPCVAVANEQCLSHSPRRGFGNFLDSTRKVRQRLTENSSAVGSAGALSLPHKMHKMPTGARRSTL